MMWGRENTSCGSSRCWSHGRKECKCFQQVKKVSRPSVGEVFGTKKGHLWSGRWNGPNQNWKSGPRRWQETYVQVDMDWEEGGEVSVWESRNV